MVRKLLSFVVLFFYLLGSSQNISQFLKTHYESELKSKSLVYDFKANPNTANYDLRYQRIEGKINPASVFFEAKVTSHFVPKVDLEAIYFDFTTDLVVSSVDYHSISLNFQQLSTKELKIDFPTNLPANVLDSLTIKYSGVPSSANRGLYFQTHTDGPVAFTVSEPYGAREWFPTKQSLEDKIEKVDIKMTTPNSYSVAANGRLISESQTPTERTAFWQTNYPIPAYLVAFSVGNYIRKEEVIGNSNFPFVNYIYPSSNTTADLSNIDFTKTLMLFFEEKFGEYPFKNEKYGHMQFTFPGAGMEHTTMSSMGSWEKELIAHELLHQWFGNKVTCGAWNDIWLNEGFGVFAQHLVNENYLMNSTEFQNYLKLEMDYITSLIGGSVYVSDSVIDEIGSIFNFRLTYTKSGFIVRMLKWILGDEVFYAALKYYLNQPTLAYNYAKTEDFKLAILESSGRDISEFLNDWIYGEGYPTYDIRWKQVNDKITLVVNQEQSHPSVSYFEMPLPIKLVGQNNEELFLRLDNTTNNQTFVVPVEFEVKSVLFNYENQIIEKNSIVTNDPSLEIKDEIQENLMLASNPVGDYLKLVGNKKPIEYEVLTLYGQRLKKGVTKSMITVKDLEKGVYLLKVNNKSLKFIKN